MFTGIIERTAKVVSLTRPLPGADVLMAAITQLIIDPGQDFETVRGDSVAVNGCCLTVTNDGAQRLAFDVSRETMALTNLGSLREGEEVNVERALRLGDRLGGHLVTGHVDGLGVVERLEKNADGWALAVALPAALGRYVIAKGSICVDGVSLTVNSLTDRRGDGEPDSTLVQLMLIPTTVTLTAFKAMGVGKEVNIEVDGIGKFVERLTTVYRR